MRILVTNDDGILSPGLRILAQMLSENHEVYVVAPYYEQSAKSRSLNINKELLIRKSNIKNLSGEAYSLEGSPADCVRVALTCLLKDKNIDFVFSGCNFGYNAGTDITYSGTVAACAEANIHGLPAIAVSTDVVQSRANFTVANTFAIKVFNQFKDFIIDRKLILNVNVPNLSEENIEGIKICEIGNHIYDSYVIKNNGKYDYAITNGRIRVEPKTDTDRDYLKRGFVTVTPLQYSFHKDETISELNKML